MLKYGSHDPVVTGDLFDFLKTLAKPTHKEVSATASIAKKAEDIKGSVGRVYEFVGDEPPKLVESGVRLGETGDILFKPSVLRKLHREGKLESIYTKPGPNATWLQKLQHKAGIGPEFQERPGGFVQTLLRAVRSIKAIHTGEAKFAGKRYKSSPSSLLNVVAGSTIPLEERLPEYISRGKYYKQAGEPIKPGFFDRIKAYLGISEDVDIVKASAFEPGRMQIEAADLLIPPKTGGLKPLTKSAYSATEKTIGPTGTLSARRTSEFYTSSANPIDKLYDFANYLTIRLNTLASSQMLGIGYRASGSLTANALRLAAIPAIYIAGTEAIKYADYEIGELTGVRPSFLVSDLYTKARVLQQQARETTGIRKGAETFELTFPGISAGLAGTGLAALGAFATLKGTGSFKAAAAAGAAIYSLIGGPDVAQKPKELEEEYEGIRKVPVRSSSYWLLGYAPFIGGHITHHEPSWYVKHKSQAYKTNIYGSEKEYWSSGTFLPTPQNWFGLKNIIDPYKLERENYYRRPYPTTAGWGEEFPIIGPLVADTIGEIFKPRVRMHEEDNQRVVISNLQQRGAPKDIASYLGIPELPVSIVEYGKPEVLRERLKKYANVALEPAGIWKFALQYFGISFDEGYEEATASNMGSISRRFYEANLGGAFGESEFLRRFLLSDYGRASKFNQQLNPIPNYLPRWLPGSLSNFEEDRAAFYDFSLGDAYTKIQGGEYNLPGVGYESYTPLHGKEAEREEEKIKFTARVVKVVDADTVDISINGGRQRIRLAETMAPEKNTTEGQIAIAAMKSLLSPGDNITVETTRDEFDSGESQGPYGRTIARIWKNGLSINRAMVDSGHATQIDSSYDAVDRFLILSNIAPFSRAYKDAERQVRHMHLTEDWQARVNAAYEEREAKVDRLGLKKYLQEEAEAAKLSPQLRVIRSTYQSVHENLLSEIPIVGSKFFPKRNPVDLYRKFEVEGSGFANWEEPYETILRPAIYDIIGNNPVIATAKAGGLTWLASSSMGKWLNPISALAYPANRAATIASAAAVGGALSTTRMVATGKLEGGFTPPHIEEEREVEEYFDQLKYLKHRNLEEAANDEQAYHVANYAKKQSRKTLLYGLHALETKGNIFAYKGALKSKERAYFEAFVEAPEEDRSDILSMTPDHMKRALEAIWDRQRKDRPPVEEQAEQYWDKHAMPKPTWIGWHPDIDDDEVRIKAIEGGINGISDNLQRFGYFPSQRREVKARFGYLTSPVDDIHPASKTFELPWKVKKRGGNILSEFNFGAGAAINLSNINISDDRSEEIAYFANYIR